MRDAVKPEHYMLGVVYTQSDQWVSNPRPQPWQGCALPLSYDRRMLTIVAHLARVCGVNLLDLTPGCLRLVLQVLVNLLELGQWELNPRPSAYQTDALTRLSYTPLVYRACGGI